MEHKKGEMKAKTNQKWHENQIKARLVDFECPGLSVPECPGTFRYSDTQKSDLAKVDPGHLDTKIDFQEMPRTSLSV